MKAQQAARSSERLWQELSRASFGSEHDELSALRLDQKAYQTYGGRVVTRGTTWIPVDARQAFLKKARAKGDVEIVDPDVSGTPAPAGGTAVDPEDAKTYFAHPWWSSKREAYAVRPLEDAVRIDCVSGFSFVVRHRPDRGWFEETKVAARGSESGYPSLSAAAASRCAAQP